MKRVKLIALAATSFVLPLSVQAGDGDFQVAWRADVLPNEAKPAWTLQGGAKQGQGKGAVTLEDGALVLDAPAARKEEGVSYSSHSYTITDPRYWKPGTEGTTVEFRLKIDGVADQGQYAAGIGFLTQERSVRFTFSAPLTYAAGISRWEFVRFTNQGIK